jgi:hypothetical protein
VFSRTFSDHLRIFIEAEAFKTRTSPFVVVKTVGVGVPTKLDCDLFIGSAFSVIGTLEVDVEGGRD